MTNVSLFGLLLRNVCSSCASLVPLVSLCTKSRDGEAGYQTIRMPEPNYSDKKKTCAKKEPDQTSPQCLFIDMEKISISLRSKNK